jgi:hypothetical protein
MCVPEERPAFLLRDEPGQQDQSVAKVACYPSESSLVKMLYRSGFGNVYEVMDLPDHEDFRETPDRARKRTILLASSVPVEVGGFRLVLEPREVEDLWVKKPASKATFAQRVGRFLASPARRKYITLANRARRIFPKMPIPLQLPFGAWWLAENSALDHELLYGEFEKMETDFVNRLLRRDMTVVDVGAHHGLYTTGLQARGMGWSRRGHRTLSPGMRAAGKALAHQSLFRTWSWCRVQSEKILLRRISMWWMDFTTGATACGLPLWKHRRPPCASRYVVWTTFSRS